MKLLAEELASKTGNVSETELQIVPVGRSLMEPPAEQFVIETE